MKLCLVAALALAATPPTEAAVPHHPKLWATGNRAAMGPAERAHYDKVVADAQTAAKVQLAAARAVLAAPVEMPEEASDHTWVVRNDENTTCGVSDGRRWIIRSTGGETRRWRTPSAALWSSSGCAGSRPRLISHEEAVRRSNAQTEALLKGLSFDDLKGEMQEVGERPR